MKIKFSYLEELSYFNFNLKIVWRHILKPFKFCNYLIFAFFIQSNLLLHLELLLILECSLSQVNVISKPLLCPIKIHITYQCLWSCIMIFVQSKFMLHITCMKMYHDIVQLKFMLHTMFIKFFSFFILLSNQNWFYIKAILKLCLFFVYVC